MNEYNDKIPEMPKKLPKLIALLTSKTPEIYKAAVANAVFPPLATHLCQVRFTYTDNKMHEATLMNCLMAPTGAGKSCIDEPIQHIMADTLFLLQSTCNLHIVCSASYTDLCL